MLSAQLATLKFRCLRIESDMHRREKVVVWPAIKIALENSDPFLNARSNNSINREEPCVDGLSVFCLDFTSVLKDAVTSQVEVAPSRLVATIGITSVRQR
jgi:hypothetical protein